MVEDGAKLKPELGATVVFVRSPVNWNPDLSMLPLDVPDVDMGVVMLLLDDPAAVVTGIPNLKEPKLPVVVTPQLDDAGTPAAGIPNLKEDKLEVVVAAAAAAADVTVAPGLGVSHAEHTFDSGTFDT